MRVRMFMVIAGTRDGADWPPAGGIIDLPDTEAADLIAAGIAGPVAPVVEAAVPPAPETATVDTKPKPRKGRRG